MLPASVVFMTSVGNAAALSNEPHYVRVVGESASTTNQLQLVYDEREDRERPWQQFLEASTAPRGPFSTMQVRAARRFWRDVTRRATKQLPLPASRESAQGTLLLVWESPDNIVEAEVLEDGSFEWFAKDKTSGRYEGSDDERIQRVPDRVIDALEAAFAV